MNESKIRELLLARGREMLGAPAAEFAADQKANKLLTDLDHHSHAFVIVCIVDRQIKAERAWRIPYELPRRIA